MRRIVCAVALAGVGVLATGAAVAASPVSGSVFGPVTSVKGETFVLKTALSPSGSSTVHLGSSTAITEQAAGSRADLRKGVCATANGAKNSKGVVAATRVTVSAPVNGQCGGFGGGGRPAGSSSRTPPSQRPSGTRPGGFANFGFASGTITQVKGSTLTLHGARGTSTVTVSSKTTITKTVRVGSSSIKVKLCAFVFGTSTDKGINVAAQSVALSRPTSSGCTSRFPRS